MTFFWSLDQLDVETLGVTSIRPSVRYAFSRKQFITFSKTLQSVRACKREKNVPSAFLKKIPVLPILAKSCPKLAILAQNAQK